MSRDGATSRSTVLDAAVAIDLIAVCLVGGLPLAGYATYRPTRTSGPERSAVNVWVWVWPLVRSIS